MLRQQLYTDDTRETLCLLFMEWRSDIKKGQKRSDKKNTKTKIKSKGSRTDPNPNIIQDLDRCVF